MSPRRHVEDYQSVIDHIKATNLGGRVDGQRIALWGVSYRWVRAVHAVRCAHCALCELSVLSARCTRRALSVLSALSAGWGMRAPTCRSMQEAAYSMTQTHSRTCIAVH